MHIISVRSVVSPGIRRLLHGRVCRVAGHEVVRREEVRRIRAELRALHALVEDGNPGEHTDGGLLHDSREGSSDCGTEADQSPHAVAAAAVAGNADSAC